LDAVFSGQLIRPLITFFTQKIITVILAFGNRATQSIAHIMTIADNINTLEFATVIAQAPGMHIHLKIAKSYLLVRQTDPDEHLIDLIQSLRITFRFNRDILIGDGSDDRNVFGDFSLQFQIQAGLQRQSALAAQGHTAIERSRFQKIRIVRRILDGTLWYGDTILRFTF